MDENRTFAFNFSFGGNSLEVSQGTEQQQQQQQQQQQDGGQQHKEHAQESTGGKKKGKKRAKDVKVERESPPASPSPAPPAAIPSLPAEEVSIPLPSPPRLADMDAVLINDRLTLYRGRVNTKKVAERLQESRVAESDLIPGVYEGGFKLWEGAMDLSCYLCTEFGLEGKELLKGGSGCSDIKGKKVLELGCGHGLPGLTLLLAGHEVHFQDYNKEVLEELTASNIAANLARVLPPRAHLPVRFFAGDWSHTGAMMEAKGLAGKYEVVLSSESIYHVDSQRPLLDCIKQVLHRPNGIAYIASKTYYFGVGGGTKTFREMLDKDATFEVSTVFRLEESSSGNVREIIKLSFPKARASK